MLTNRFASASESEREFADGEYIVREGEAGREMFVIKSGNVIVRRAGTILHSRWNFSRR